MINKRMAEVSSVTIGNETDYSVTCKICHCHFGFSTNKKSKFAIDSPFPCPECKANLGSTEGYKGMNGPHVINRGIKDFELR